MVFIPAVGVLDFEALRMRDVTAETMSQTLPPLLVNASMNWSQHRTTFLSRRPRQSGRGFSST